MKYVADRLKNTQLALALDTDALAKYDDIIDLSIGDTDFITDGRIIDAACRDAHAGATRYGMPQGDPELIKAIQNAWQEDFGQDIPTEELFVSASSCLGMSLVMMAMLNPGDEVIVFGPYFGVYRQQIELSGGVCVEVLTREENGYHLEEAEIERAVTPRTRAMILNNPCNPTGAAYSREDLECVARIAKKHDLIVVADEIYTRYVFDGAFIPFRTLPGIEKRTVTLNSFSKNFMMTGWRVGCIIAPEPLRKAIQYVNGGLIYTAPSISQRAAIEALRLREDIAEKYITKYRERVYYASERIQRMPYFTLIPPKGTFYLFPGIKKTGLPCEQFCGVLLRQAHVLVSPGTAFGKAGDGHIRLAMTAPMEQIREAMDRMDHLSF